MAEQEVVKHTKKIYKVWQNSHTSVWHKIKEFAIEILIIVFAVSISIWFHNLSEKRHDRHEVNNFLVGLKSDFSKDTFEIHQDMLSYMETDSMTNYFLSLKPNEQLDSLKLERFSWTLFNSTVLVPNKSRFEALKYSGLMAKFENKFLLDEILGLYEEQIPRVVRQGEKITEFKKEKFGDKLFALYYSDKERASTFRKFLSEDKYALFDLKRVSQQARNILNEYKITEQQYLKVDSLIDVELKK
jgi:hypothetical protein